MKNNRFQMQGHDCNLYFKKVCSNKTLRVISISKVNVLLGFLYLSVNTNCSIMKIIISISRKNAVLLFLGETTFRQHLLVILMK